MRKTARAVQRFHQWKQQQLFAEYEKNSKGRSTISSVETATAVRRVREKQQGLFNRFSSAPNPPGGFVSPEIGTG
jgi:hypothetical protein